MHSNVLAQRNALAHADLLRVATAIAERYDLHGDVAALEAVKTAKASSAVTMLKEKEAMLNLLTNLALALGIETGITVANDDEAQVDQAHEPAEDDEAQADQEPESPDGHEQAHESAEEDEESVTEKQPSRRKRA